MPDMSFWVNNRNRWMTAVEMVDDINDLTKSYKDALDEIKRAHKLIDKLQDECDDLTSELRFTKGLLLDSDNKVGLYRAKLEREEKGLDMLLKNLNKALKITKDSLGDPDDIE